MSRGHRLLAVLAAVAAAGVLATAAGAATVHCGAASVGPGSLHRGGTAGARCMLVEFHDHCHPADYLLSAFGVDTVHQETFRLALRSHRCLVLVTETFRVVPQQLHMVGQRACSRLRRSGPDVIADVCTGGPPAVISLTTLS